MMQDKTLQVLSEEKQQLIKNIDTETDELKKLRLEEQLQSLQNSIDRYKEELRQKMESMTEKEIKVPKDHPAQAKKQSLWKEYKQACQEYKQIQELVAESRQRKKDLRIKLGIDKSVRQ